MMPSVFPCSVPELKLHVWDQLMRSTKEVLITGSSLLVRGILESSEDVLLGRRSKRSVSIRKVPCLCQELTIVQRESEPKEFSEGGLRVKHSSFDMVRTLYFPREPNENVQTQHMSLQCSSTIIHSWEELVFSLREVLRAGN